MKHLKQHTQNVYHHTGSSVVPSLILFLLLIIPGVRSTNRSCAKNIPADQREPSSAKYFSGVTHSPSNCWSSHISNTFNNILQREAHLPSSLLKQVLKMITKSVSKTCRTRFVLVLVLICGALVLLMCFRFGAGSSAHVRGRDPSLKLTGKISSSSPSYLHI